MKPIGLTGNIGCGKSTVAQLLAKLPYVHILNCDTIAKEFVLSGTYKGEIKAIFGQEVFTKEALDPRKLANVLFANREKRKALERLIHPLVWKSVEEKTTTLPSRELCIVESAILFETKAESRFSKIIVTVCNEQVVRERLKKNRHMSDDEIDARLRNQLPSSEKVARAQFVIDTNCSLEELETKVRTLYETLTHEKGNV